MRRGDLNGERSFHFIGRLHAVSHRNRTVDLGLGYIALLPENLHPHRQLTTGKVSGARAKGILEVAGPCGGITVWRRDGGLGVVKFPGRMTCLDKP